jgi:hypothetical protein
VRTRSGFRELSKFTRFFRELRENSDFSAASVGRLAIGVKTLIKPRGKNNKGKTVLPIVHFQIG